MGIFFELLTWMKKLSFVCVFLILVSCSGNRSNNNFTPSPEKLIQDPFFKDQIDEIDIERLQKNKEALSELLKKNRITKINNGTKPIIIEVERSKPSEDGILLLDENGDELIDPIHDRQLVEEYYVLKKDEEPPVEPLKELVKIEEEELTLDLSDEEEPIVTNPVPEVDELKVELQKEKKVEKKADQEVDQETVVTFDLSGPDQKEEAKAKGDIEEKTEIDLSVTDSPRPVKEDIKIDLTPTPLPRPKHVGTAVVEENDKKEDEVKELVELVENKEIEEDSSAVEDLHLPPLPRPNPIPFAERKKRPAKRGPYKASWDGRSTAKRYTNYTLNALEKYGKHLLNPNLKMKSHIKRFCKNYNVINKDQRRRFWLTMISGLAKLESGFATNKAYKETDLKLAGVISRGLMQLSLDSVKQRAYKCDKKFGIRKIEDLYNSRKNLRCAVVIMNYNINRDRKIHGFKWRKCEDGSSGCRTWFGAGRYWGPIRRERYQIGVNISESRYQEVLDLERSTRKLNFCR